MKIIKFNTPDGEYSLPLDKVAKNRADNYYEQHEPEWQDEFEFVMEDHFEGIDWLLNNTDYEDWEDMTTKLNDNAKVSNKYFWTSSEDFEIINQC